MFPLWSPRPAKIYQHNERKNSVTCWQDPPTKSLDVKWGLGTPLLSPNHLSILYLGSFGRFTGENVEYQVLGVNFGPFWEGQRPFRKYFKPGPGVPPSPLPMSGLAQTATPWMDCTCDGIVDAYNLGEAYSRTRQLAWVITDLYRLSVDACYSNRNGTVACFPGDLGES